MTTDFTSLLAAVPNKALLVGYQETPATWDSFVKQTDVRDYKTQSRTALSEAPGLDNIKEHGDYKYGSWSDRKETFAAGKKGKLFAVTREAIINDDLGALTDAPVSMGRAANRAVSDDIWGLLTANAAMGDGVAIFHSTHKNLGTQGALSETTLTELRKLMRLQTGMNGALLNIGPRFLLVPATLETVADKLLYSTGTLDENKSSAVINPFNGKLVPIVEPRLDAASTTAYYLAADPSQCDVIELAWLGGSRGPYLESRDGWTVDGIEYKVRIEYGCAVLDWRGLAKNVGQ